MKKDHRGFSLVELIIVIAIAGILVGASTTMMGHIRYANAKKAVETVSDMLDRQRINSMTRQGTQYLYIYRLNDGYYMKVLNLSLDAYNASFLDDSGVKICGENMTVSSQLAGGTPAALGRQSGIIRIVFKRSGALKTDGSDATTADQIIFTGSSTHTITLYSETGKHAID